MPKTNMEGAKEAKTLPPPADVSGVRIEAARLALALSPPNAGSLVTDARAIAQFLLEG